MANTFTSNYSLTKSEIGGDNQSWGSNLHTTLDEIDLELGSKVDDNDIKGFSSTGLVFANTGTSTGTITVSSGDLFQNFKTGDKIRVSGNTGTGAATNGSAVAPATHTITSASANSVTVSTGLVANSGDTVIVALVLEPKHISSGTIICAPPTGDTTTNALVATGSATLGGSTSGDTVTFTSKIASDFHPKTDNTYDLGTVNNSWQHIHAQGTSTLTTVAIAGGTVAGITVTTTGASGSPGPGSAEKVVNLAVTGVSGSYTNFNMGSNGQGAKTVSEDAPASTTGYANGDVWYEIP